MRVVSYREHAPPPALAAWLACMWERRGEAARPVRVLPDGCIDVVWSEGAGTQIVGANTTAFLVSVTPGARVVGARLRPGAGPSLLGVVAEAVRDAQCALEEVWVRDGARLVAELDDQADPVATLRGALLARAVHAERPDQLVAEAVRRLEQPTITVSQVAGELGVSERGLRRRVSTAVGYGPKRLVRVLRLLRALEAARAGGDLARAALEAGYADQAHFANDCRELAGVSPSVALAS